MNTWRTSVRAASLSALALSAAYGALLFSHTAEFFRLQLVDELRLDLLEEHSLMVWRAFHPNGQDGWSLCRFGDSPEGTMAVFSIPSLHVVLVGLAAGGAGYLSGRFQGKKSRTSRYSATPRRGPFRI